MNTIAALPMYDWPEVRGDVDAQWAAARDRLRDAGVDAPDTLTRGIDLHALWRSSDLLLAQTCWGPMELGLAEHVQVVGQPSYDAFEGGEGPFYSSAILVRGDDGGGHQVAGIPVNRLRGRRFAFNGDDSMSGILALTRDLEALGDGIDIFSEHIATGAHRASIAAVAEGRADVCTIDCRSWDMAKRFEPAASRLAVVGWTMKRKGLPFITALSTPLETLETLRTVLGVKP